MKSTANATMIVKVVYCLCAAIAAGVVAAASGGAASVISATDIAAAGSSVDASDPEKLIRSASQAMLRELDAHRPQYRQDPQSLRALVDSVLLAHFDTEYAGRQVLAAEWKNATADQRQRFVAGFYQSMLSNYGSALLEFTGDRLKVLPYKGEPGQKSATVQTQIRKSDGSDVAVNYSLRLTEQGWKAWDVKIEGISYVKSFRDDFATEIGQKGLDAVIERLEAQAKAKSAGTGARQSGAAKSGK